MPPSRSLQLLTIAGRITSIRGLATRASSAYLSEHSSTDPSTSTSPKGLSPAERNVLESALRVDQAGEIAANWIYAGQLAVLKNNRSVAPLIQEMWNQEKHHLAVMDKLLQQHHARPTVLTEVAKVVAFGVGAFSAMLGPEAAMACTEAVETVIGEHYNDQLRELDELPSEHPSVGLLKDVLREFRDDELEHLDTAVDNGAQKAPAHALLSAAISSGCEIAVELCKRY